MKVNLVIGSFLFLFLALVFGFLEKQQGYERERLINQKGVLAKRKLDSSFFPSRPPTRTPTVKPSTSPPSNNYGQLAPLNYFQYTGVIQSVIVPAGVTSIYIYMWGAGGASFDSYGVGGGAGAYVEGTLLVTPGSALSVLVGGGGIYGNINNGAFGGGGGGNNCTSCAGGGGRSAILLNGEDIVTAGGGGGGLNSYQGGAATSFSGGRIQSTAFQGSDGVGSKMTTQCSGYGSGGGGSNTTGGCGYPNYGAKYQGGAAGFSFGAGGGGGYYGGGGGYEGGGGSSYLAQLTTFNFSQSATTSSYSCNGIYSVYYNASSCGKGGWTYSTSGENGLVVIRTTPLFSTFLPSKTPTKYPTRVPTTFSPTIKYGQLNPVNYFAYTGTIQSVTVPAGVSSIYIYMWGGGGSGNQYGSQDSCGGAGAYVEGTLPVTAGSTLNVIVAGGGWYNLGGFGGGGQGSAGGGGRSAIQLNGSDIVTAGGGGGSGDGHNYQFCGGAAASYGAGQIQSTSFQGGSNAMSSSCYILNDDYYYYYSTGKAAGGGGSTIRGGCGNPNNGTKYQGGAGVNYGGGGGGGFFGGGGGSETPGGGGSSYLSQLTSYSLSQSGVTSSYSCNGQYSAYFNASQCGQGGLGYSYAQNGYVVIRTTPLYSTFSPSAKPTISPTLVPSTSSPSINYGQLSTVNIFRYTGTLQSVTIPSGVSAIYVYMWGAGGANATMLLGGGSYKYVEGYPGGAGAYVEGTLPITPGSSVSVLVGGGGRLFNISNGKAQQGSFGGGGGCLSTSPASCQSYYCFCLGGGGRSAIQYNGEDILTAGGGGGGGLYTVGGAASSYNNGLIRPTSFSSGYPVMSTSCSHAIVAGGGSNTTGGCGHPNYGMKYQGGATQGFYGGGGGGGYYGGGGGGGSSSGSSYEGGGGGGGSSYLNRLTTLSLSESGSYGGPYCNGKYSSYFNASSCGQGSNGDQLGSGQNGLVVITLLYSPSSSPVTLSRTPTGPTKSPSTIPTYTLVPSSSPSQSPSTSYPSLVPSLFPTTATATNQDFFASQSISGLNISQYLSSKSYQTSLVETIVQAFTSPPINASQVTNLVVSAGTSSARRRLSTSTPSIVASYQIAVNSQFPVSAYSTQLTASVNSGTFNKNLQINAENAGATGFVNATSGPVSVAATPLVPTASPVFSPSSSGGSNLSGGAIAGIVIGIVAFVCLIGAAVWFYLSRSSVNNDGKASEAPKVIQMKMANPMKK